jgi:hypothetical protein
LQVDYVSLDSHWSMRTAYLQAPFIAPDQSITRDIHDHGETVVIQLTSGYLVTDRDIC